MRNISLMSKEERVAELRNIIRYKCRTISDKHLELIMSKLNPKRHYFIKVTSNSIKFQNLMTNEVVDTSEKNIISVVLPFYGTFQPGFFKKTNDGIINAKGTMPMIKPAAGLKKTVVFEKGVFSKSYTLVIFESI